MFRIKLAAVFLGGMLAFWGYQEYSVGRKSSEKPEKIFLSKIESGEKKITNNHIRITKHYRVLEEAIYQSTEKSEDEIEVVYYPIISIRHPKYKSRKKKSPEEIINSMGGKSEIGKFSVLVKTHEFKHVNDFIRVVEKGEFKKKSIQGLVINKIDKLKADEKALLRKSFPEVDLDNIIILEEGRKPKGTGVCFASMIGGGLISILGIVSFFAFKEQG